MQKKTIRHLDTCGYKTFLEVKYPRVKCPLCGQRAVKPPFADDKERFTTEFEERVIQLCQNSSVQKAARDMDMDWHAVEGIKKRGLKRGRERRGRRKVRNLAVDETSYRKNHNYTTVVSDNDSGDVLAALDGRGSKALLKWLRTQEVADFSELRSVSMDMSPAYIKAAREFFKNADELICFDRFHVAQLFGRAVDEVRRKESAAYKKGENPLAKTRFEWLRNSGRADNRSAKRKGFLAVARGPFLTAKAWRLKEAAAGLWGYKNAGSAGKAWKKLLWRLSHSRIEELKELGKTVRKHLPGILNAARLKADNGAAEAMNCRIQGAKRLACGFRDKARFGEEIMFQFGGLNMSF